MKTLLTTMTTMIALSAFAVSANAAAHSKACDDDTVAMVMGQVEAASGDAKTMAMEEFAMAKEKMEAGMADDCSGHLTKASDLATK